MASSLPSGAEPAVPSADAPVRAAPTPNTSAPEVTVLVCSSCRRAGDGPETPRPGSRLADALAAALGADRGADPGVTVRRVACLGNCNRGLSAAVYRTGCWTYVFGGLDEASGGDLLDGARLFAGSADGFMPYRGRPAALRRGLIARVPSPDLLKDLP